MAKRVRRPAIQFDGRDLVDSHGPHKPVRIILHDTESHDHAGVKDIQGICRYWKAQGRGYGAHVIVDSAGNSGLCVSAGHVAWHTGGRNTGSLGIEIIGFAKWPRAAWLRRLKQLHKVARWMAFYSKAYNIPLTKGINFGVSTHQQQSKAFGGSHWDPGPGFPFDFVMRLARTYKKVGW